ncbi:hypothetical protein CsSME_00009448 [Camellia sinensis var. sinensis]
MIFLENYQVLKKKTKIYSLFLSPALDTCHHHRHHYHCHHSKHSHNGPHHPRGHSNYPPHTLSTPSRHLYHPHHHHLHLQPPPPPLPQCTATRQALAHLVWYVLAETIPNWRGRGRVTQSRLCSRGRPPTGPPCTASTTYYQDKFIP